MARVAVRRIENYGPLVKSLTAGIAARAKKNGWPLPATRLSYTCPIKDPFLSLLL